METIQINRALSELTKPEHPVLLVSGSPEKEINVMAAGWVMRTSFKPPLMAVSIGFSRHTHLLMEREDFFVLSYPGPGQEKLVEIAGTSSGRDTDKFSVLNEAVQTGEKSSLPVFKEARVNFECEKTDAVKTGDHTIFVGRVLSARGNPEMAPLINVGNYNYREFQL